MESLYKSETGKAEILNLYNQKLKDLNINYRYHEIETAFGKTNVIVTGDSSKPPILVVHGSNGCAPIALETYSGLESHFQIFAVDVLAQPNKSVETRLSMKNDDYGKWLHEVIDNLELKNATLAGFSFGGLVILKTLEFKDNNIKEVFLTAPAYIANGNPLKALFKVFIPMKRYMKSKKIKYVERFLNQLFTEKDDFALQFLSKVFLHFTMDFTPVPVINRREANSIKTPITLITAKNDLMFPGAKMIKRANRIFPSLKKTVLLEQSKHVQNKIDNKRIVNLICDDFE
ncbi:alpha/beta hydrolase [uncultured Winogradskyella sp.]|uniref:alpha/beta hydrolase n=1 Tax=uncultured Winogradskyella sp. TaxID=395353 RepID=UPI00262E8F23|nr:alpha/beta hydrolase [uncultured Winogradskyella sp.]|tara:strand:+ start:10638 stop:11501 length:864 start_codon:yes stop_codon:yes gene_type:complete